MRPFLKWAGGKRQLLPRIRPFYPRTFGGYHEPFLGSGAVFFDLATTGRLEGQPATLTDENPDLIGTWLRVRDSLEDVLNHLTRLARGHARGGRDHYWRVRDRQFNPARLAWASRGAQVDAYGPELAAMLIYLNRTGYNGLFRVNRAGAFNVPPGRYVRPRIADAELLAEVSATLRRPGIHLGLAPFESVLERVRSGDFVYLDPPYAPLTPTANFRGYTAGGFEEADQARVQRVVLALAARGVQVVLSNSSAPVILELFEGRRDVRDHGLRVYRVPARRAINTRADRRGTVDEVLVSNVQPCPD